MKYIHLPWTRSCILKVLYCLFFIFLSLPQFQPPIDSHLSQQLEAEIANSGLPHSINFAACVSNPQVSQQPTSANMTSEPEIPSVPNGDSNMTNSNICASCQCHACLKQSGHVISTSLPLQVCCCNLDFIFLTMSWWSGLLFLAYIKSFYPDYLSAFFCFTFSHHSPWKTLRWPIIVKARMRQTYWKWTQYKYKCSQLQ